MDDPSGGLHMRCAMTVLSQKISIPLPQRLAPSPPPLKIPVYIHVHIASSLHLTLIFETPHPSNFK